MKDKEPKKKTLRSLALPFLEQLQIHLRDLLEYILQLSVNETAENHQNRTCLQG